MTRDEILQLAEQVDFRWEYIGIDALETFAKLVAAREREECAKVCDDLQSQDCCVDVRIAAKEIRTRGKS